MPEDVKKNKKRWYDKKDPSKRSIGELLFYKFIAAPHIRKKYQKKVAMIVENFSFLETAVRLAKANKLALIVVSNHLDDEDTTLLPFLIDKAGSFCYKIAKIELFAGFWNKVKMYWVGCRPIDRGANTRDIWIIEKLIKDKKVIMLFPTGHRDPENETPMEIGGPMLINKHKREVVVLPVRLIDTDKIKYGEKPIIIFSEPRMFVGEDYPDSMSTAKKIMHELAGVLHVPTKTNTKRIRQEGE